MSLESSVDTLKLQHRTLDETVHSLAMVMADLKDLALCNKQNIDSLKDDTTILKAEMVVVRNDIAKLDQKVERGLADIGERFSQLELLIHQHFTPN